MNELEYEDASTMNDKTYASLNQDKMGPYSGKDPYLHEKPYCKTCSKEEAASLLRCSQCRLVHYCCRQCQKDDWSIHKPICNRINNLTLLVAEEVEPLRNFSAYTLLGGTDEPESVDLLDTEVGNFWGAFETRDYMRARIDLANEVYDNIACQYETREVWETVLAHYQDMLRLSSSDNLGLRFRFPFLLMALNRDDDAYNFIRHWIKNEGEDDEDIELLHAESEEGEWLYGHQKDSRLLDIFQDCPNANSAHMDLPLLVSLALIKMRLIAALEAPTKSFEHFQSTTGGATLSPVGSVIAEYVVGDEVQHQKIKAQKAQLDRLLNAIHSNNPTMLLALVNPEPLLKHEPRYYTRGAPSECREVLPDARRICARIPGALEVLEARVGRNPTYIDTD